MKFKIPKIFLLIFFLTSCSTIKDGFKNPKKNNSDEFLVEKKSPLVMPPDYNELPKPELLGENENSKKNEIKTLIIDEEYSSQDNENLPNESLEKELLKKIKKK
jgi:hypothetical protein|tara:strand:+ start:58 stop:369 length:312 start_codon:yes stop_codon:yes gene_type:complete